MTEHDPGQSERLTRKQLINPKLEAWGWTVVPFELAASARPGCYAITEHPTASGPADYALSSDGRALAVVEAKKLTLGPHGVLTQAERYPRGLRAGPFDFDGLRVPFLYSTNGEVRSALPARPAVSAKRATSRSETTREEAGAGGFHEERQRDRRVRPAGVDASSAAFEQQ